MPRHHRLLLIILLTGLTISAARHLPIPEERPYDVEVIPSSRVARWLSFGHPTLLADLYWLRAVQYIGDSRANARGWERLFPLVDLVTDLDPEHGYAYQVAGTLLGSVGRVDESNAILEKGIRQVPHRYILPYLRAFNAFYYEGDYAAAGRFVEIAARIPGAPTHLRQNVLAMYVKGGRAEAALAFLREARAQARDPEALRALDEQIRRAQMEGACESVDETIALYREKHFFPPFAVGALIAEGLLDRVPADPYGGHLYIGEDGRTHSSVHPHRFAPPEKKGQQTNQEPGIPGRGAGASPRRVLP